MPSTEVDAQWSINNTNIARLVYEVSGCPVNSDGCKSKTSVSVVGVSAGTTELVAASSGKKHKVMGAVLVMDAAGTLKFTSTSDLSGAMDLAANAGFVLPTASLPYMQGGLGLALSLVTTVGKAKGIVIIKTE